MKLVPLLFPILFWLPPSLAQEETVSPSLLARCTEATTCEECVGVFNSSDPINETIACVWHVTDNTCKTDACGENSNDCSLFHCPGTPDGDCFYTPSSFDDCEGCLAMPGCQYDALGCTNFDEDFCRDVTWCTSSALLGAEATVQDACAASQAEIDQLGNPLPTMSPTKAPTEAPGSSTENGSSAGVVSSLATALAMQVVAAMIITREAA